MNIKVKIDGKIYYPSKGFGTQLTSYENGVKHGDTRIIADELMYAYVIRKSFWFFTKDEVGWSLYELKNQDEKFEYIRTFYRKIVGI